jgi:hypothetical protein
LSLVLAVVQAPTEPEADIPFEPAARVMREVDPAGGFPFREALAARDGVFVQGCVVVGCCEVFCGWVQLGTPVLGQGVEMVILQGEVEGA